MQYTPDLTWHGVLLTELAKRMRPALYIEFGTQTGRTIHAVSEFCDRAIGVDVNPPDSKFRFGSRWEFFQMTTDDFVKNHLRSLPPVELALIDADHEQDQAFKDGCALIDELPPNGIVMFHDTYPSNEQHLKPGYCHDSYRVPTRLASLYACECDVLTLPIPPGLTIVRKIPQPDGLHWRK